MTISSAATAAESRQTTSSVESLYRAHRFSSSPQLNPNTTFKIRELDVPNLWSSLRLQLFEAEDMFVEADKGGRVCVVEGQWRGFNRWESPRPLGWIDFGEHMRLKVVDEEEREILQRR